MCKLACWLAWLSHPKSVANETPLQPKLNIFAVLLCVLLSHPVLLNAQ